MSQGRESFAESERPVIGQESIEIVCPGASSYKNAFRAYNPSVYFQHIRNACPNATEDVAELIKAGAYFSLPGEPECIADHPVLMTMQYGQ